ncbi:uncharacterized protein LOC125040685 [Penaeus chinensis]|uniref:uncharacterized protein LOC125040685 n=1 Tax=Penaeus chinensis TaxID=139456 RepID=UPI001FB69C3B|nr:uncharacterized protein LOC125040685 [Penaeus chinensis]
MMGLRTFVKVAAVMAVACVVTADPEPVPGGGYGGGFGGGRPGGFSGGFGRPGGFVEAQSDSGVQVDLVDLQADTADSVEVPSEEVHSAEVHSEDAHPSDNNPSAAHPSDNNPSAAHPTAAHPTARRMAVRQRRTPEDLHANNTSKIRFTLLQQCQQNTIHLCTLTCVFLHALALDGTPDLDCLIRRLANKLTKFRMYLYDIP